MKHRLPALALVAGVLAVVLGLASQLMDTFAGASRWIVGGLAVLLALLALIQLVISELARREQAPRPPLRTADLAPAGPARFHFRARAIEFQGYGDALSELQDFVEHDGRFRWWTITGEAGTGKSRIALEVCKKSSKWESGFIARRDDFDKWREWQPRKPTLIVIDYVAARVTEARELLTTLSSRGEELSHPVRVLLLERRPDTWLAALIGTGGDKYLLEASRHREAPLHLTGLDPEARWQIVRETFANHGLPDLPDKETTLEALALVDPIGRPLFAMLVAEVLAASSGREQTVTDTRQVLRDYLQREDAAFWTVAGVTDRDKNLLAFATILGGLPVADLEHYQDGVLPDVEESSAERFDATRYQVMTGQDSRQWLAPLEPDLIGEFFVLDHLTPRPARDALAAPDSTVDVVCKWAREASPMSFLEFVYRAQQDLGDHELLARMRPPLDSEDTRRLLESAPETNDAASVLASIHAARVGVFVLQGDLDGAWDIFGQLLEFRDRHPDAHTDTLASAAAAWLTLGHLAAEDGEGAINVLEVLRGSLWLQPGQLNEPLEAFITAMVLIATMMTLTGEMELADKLAKGAVATAQMQHVERDVATVLVAGLANLIQAYLREIQVESDSAPLVKAADALKWIEELAGKTKLSEEFAFHWAFAAAFVFDAALRAAGKFKRLKQEPFFGIAKTAYDSCSKIIPTKAFEDAVSHETATEMGKRFDSFMTVMNGL